MSLFKGFGQPLDPFLLTQQPENPRGEKERRGREREENEGILGGLGSLP